MRPCAFGCVVPYGGWSRGASRCADGIDRHAAVAPGAFTESLREIMLGWQSVHMRLRHDANTFGRVPARTDDGTLVFDDRRDGLWAHIYCPRTLATIRAYESLWGRVETSAGWGMRTEDDYAEVMANIHGELRPATQVFKAELLEISLCERGAMGGTALTLYGM